MTWKGQAVLAVVPARGGSKGIIGKNLRAVAGATLVARAAAFCRELPWVDRAIVSTDDDNIAAEAEAHGLAAPFRRPNALSGDSASSIKTWQHAWSECERIDDHRYDLGLLLEPTSPMRTIEDVRKCLQALDDSSVRSSATISATPAHFTPHKSLTRTQNGNIEFFTPNGARFSIRQSIPPLYHRNGLCYAVRRKTLMEEGHIIEKDCAGILVDRPVVNIDEPLDLELAEFLLKRQEQVR